jgi:tellurite resistance protein
MSAPKIPPNLFAVPFGLAGLGEAWSAMARFHHAPAVVGEIVLLLSAVAWLVVLGAYLRHLVTDRGVLVRDLLDPVAAPFTSLALITPMLVAAQGLHPHAGTAGTVLTDVFLALTVVLGGWLTGQWIYGQVDLDRFHPGYFLPTVAGGLIGSASAAAVGQPRLGEVILGLGVVCWVVLGSIILGRLLFRPMLPPALRPTLAIEVAPAAVASLAWFQLQGDRVDAVAAFLAGYGLLMVIAQLRLLPMYLRLPFMPSTWSFTFSWAAVGTVALVWLEDGRVPGYRVYQDVVLAAVTLLVGGIAVRTAIALARRRFLPHPATPATVPATAPESSRT